MKPFAALLRDALNEPALVTIDDLMVARGIFPYWGPYAVSKADLDMLVKIYAGETAKTRVRANLIDPGIVRTRLRSPRIAGARRLTSPVGQPGAGR